MDAPVSVEGLTHFYGSRRGVVDLTFAVEPGEIFGFLGPNGSGKTTTIRQLMGLIKPTRGTARIFGLDCWTDAPGVKARVGYLPGEIHYYERMTGASLLAFLASFRQGDLMSRARVLAERLELDLGQRVRHLSKGNRQKLAIVQSLMYAAPLLILDEPSSGLDPIRQVELLDLLREEQQRGVTIFLSSHLLTEVERVANRVAIIRDGELVAVEDVAHLRALRERRMDVTVREPVAPERFAELAGVRVIGADPAHGVLQLGVRGPLGPLLAVLATLPVEDLTYGPPDLESVFLHYYGVAEPAVPAPLAEVPR
ncbi:MAG TPA: ABC transporter ATP-binding protein [Thermomicrobiaceae bacterium]|nr:ABC transporter ATP-binding protein [Thermomicrobiaceae bacterium]